MKLEDLLQLMPKPGSECHICGNFTLRVMHMHFTWPDTISKLGGDHIQHTLTVHYCHSFHLIFPIVHDPTPVRKLQRPISCWTNENLHQH